MSEHASHGNYLIEPKGWKSWLTTVDHKRIGQIIAMACVFTHFISPDRLLR